MDIFVKVCEKDTRIGDSEHGTEYTYTDPVGHTYSYTNLVGHSCTYTVPVGHTLAYADVAQHVTSEGRAGVCEREFFIDNLLVQIHHIIVMIKRSGLAPW